MSDNPEVPPRGSFWHHRFNGETYIASVTKPMSMGEWQLVNIKTGCAYAARGGWGGDKGCFRKADVRIEVTVEPKEGAT
jgi:hypothetical protein